MPMTASELTKRVLANVAAKRVPPPRSPSPPVTRPMPKPKQVKPPKAPAQTPPDPIAWRERHARELSEHGLTLTDIDALTATLSERWPLAFNPLHRRALAIGTYEVILAELACDPFALSVALRRWCGHSHYLRALAFGHHRHNLEGEDVCAIATEAKAHARRRLARRALAGAEKAEET
jgi:hypothetical protein